MDAEKSWLILVDHLDVDVGGRILGLGNTFLIFSLNLKNTTRLHQMPPSLRSPSSTGGSQCGTWRPGMGWT